MTADDEQGVKRVLTLTVDRVSESGLYIAEVASPHPIVVRAYRLAEALQPIWTALGDDDYFDRWPSNFVIDLHHKYLREDNARLEALRARHTRALGRICDADHPAGPVETLEQARDIAKASLQGTMKLDRELIAAARSGAFAQSESSTDRDLLSVLTQAATELVRTLRTEAAMSDATTASIAQLKAAIDATGGITD